MINIQYEDLIMLRFYNTKSSMLYNLLRLDKARCFILDELLDTLALRGLVESLFQLCCCVSFLFWREIVFGCTYYYVL